MAPPTLLQLTRQTIGRALRETGQALDRTAILLASLAVTKHDYYDDPVIYQDFLSRHRQQMPLLHAGNPVVHPSVAYLAPCCTLIGSVRIGAGASVWYKATLRADSCDNAQSFRLSDEKILELGQEEFELDDDRHREDGSIYTMKGGGIYIGDDTNIQDGCVVTAQKDHCRIGKGVTVGHLAQIHSATVEDFCLIGMGSVLNEGVHVEREAFIAAGAVVPPGTRVGSGELWVGNPARKIRDLTTEQREKLHYQSSEYVNVATRQSSVMELGGNLSEEHVLIGEDDSHLAAANGNAADDGTR